MGRLGAIIGSFFNALLGRAEKPGLILDYAYEQFADQLVEVKKAVADVATEKFRIERQATEAQLEVDKLARDAEAELADGNEELALRILERKAQAQVWMENLVSELKDLTTQQAALEENAQELEAQIDTFRRQKEVKKAQFRSAEAQVRIGESLTGINETGVSVGRALGRINEKTEQMEARAKAIPELIKHGTLGDVVADGKSPIDREIEASRVKRDASRELAAMKERMGLHPLEAPRDPEAERKHAEAHSRRSTG